MVQKLLKQSIISGIGGGIALPLYIALLFSIPSSPIGFLEIIFLLIGLIGHFLMYFLALAVWGIPIGLVSGTVIGLLFVLVNRFLYPLSHMAHRFNIFLATIFAFATSFLIYWHWLGSQGPLIEMT